MTRTDCHFGQSFESQTQNTRSQGRSLGSLVFCFRMASCCRSARFSAANPVWLRRTDRRKMKISCTVPILLSPTHYLIYVTSHEPTWSGACVKSERPRKCPKTEFRARMRFLERKKGFRGCCPGRRLARIVPLGPAAGSGSQAASQN